MGILANSGRQQRQGGDLDDMFKASMDSLFNESGTAGGGKGKSGGKRGKYGQQPRAKPAITGF